jgi:hypothetical protein
MPIKPLGTSLNGGADVIEGRITEYRALGERETGNEYFVVGGHRFAFSEFDLRPGFKLTRRRGGPLGTGKYVRIKHRDDVTLNSMSATSMIERAAIQELPLRGANGFYPFGFACGRL